MVNPLASRLCGLDLNPGQGHCVCVLGQDTLLSVSFSSQCINGYQQI